MRSKNVALWSRGRTLLRRLLATLTTIERKGSAQYPLRSTRLALVAGAALAALGACQGDASIIVPKTGDEGEATDPSVLPPSCPTSGQPVGGTNPVRTFTTIVTGIATSSVTKTSTLSSTGTVTGLVAGDMTALATVTFVQTLTSTATVTTTGTFTATAAGEVLRFPPNLGGGGGETAGASGSGGTLAAGGNGAGGAGGDGGNGGRPGGGSGGRVSSGAGGSGGAAGSGGSQPGRGGSGGRSLADAGGSGGSVVQGAGGNNVVTPPGTGGRGTGGRQGTGGAGTGGATPTSVPASGCTEPQKTLTSNGTGQHCGYTYEYWKDTGSGSLVLTSDGFSVDWSGINNLLGRKGLRPGSKSQIVSYEANYQPSGNSYLCVYGWTKNPLVEYYIVDSWGSWRPPGGEGHMGTVTSDGGTYDIYRTQRVNQPSIEGNTTFYQFWSVRTAKRTSGAITVGNHFNAWASSGMSLGSLYEVSMTVEGYQSSGKADVKMSMR